jgi:hypothetical protein
MIGMFQCKLLVASQVAAKERPFLAVAGGGEPASREVVVRVDFGPDGRIDMIYHRPLHLTPQEWFNRLRRAAPSTYRILSAERGAFHIPGKLFDAIWLRNTFFETVTAH